MRLEPGHIIHVDISESLIVSFYSIYKIAYYMKKFTGSVTTLARASGKKRLEQCFATKENCQYARGQSPL